MKHIIPVRNIPKNKPNVRVITWRESIELAGGRGMEKGYSSGWLRISEKMLSRVPVYQFRDPRMVSHSTNRPANNSLGMHWIFPWRKGGYFGFVLPPTEARNPGSNIFPNKWWLSVLEALLHTFNTFWTWLLNGIRSYISSERSVRVGP